MSVKPVVGRATTIFSILRGVGVAGTGVGAGGGVAVGAAALAAAAAVGLGAAGGAAGAQAARSRLAITRAVSRAIVCLCIPYLPSLLISQSKRSRPHLSITVSATSGL